MLSLFNLYQINNLFFHKPKNLLIDLSICSSQLNINHRYYCLYGYLNVVHGKFDKSYKTRCYTGLRRVSHLYYVEVIVDKHCSV